MCGCICGFKHPREEYNQKYKINLPTSDNFKKAIYQPPKIAKCIYFSRIKLYFLKIMGPPSRTTKDSSIYILTTRDSRESTSDK